MIKYPEFDFRLKILRFSCVFTSFVQKNTYMLENTLLSYFTKFCAKKAKYMQNVHFSIKKTRFSGTFCAKRREMYKKQGFSKENLIFSNVV